MDRKGLPAKKTSRGDTVVPARKNGHAKMAPSPINHFSEQPNLKGTMVTTDTGLLA